MREREFAELLLRKAAQDEYAIEKMMAHEDSPDEIIGFHAQQAIEKGVKAVLAFHGIHFRKTHDLTELVDLLRENGIQFPGELEETRRLTPFATVFRYSEFWAEPDARFDRKWVLICVEKIRVWAHECVSKSPDS